MITHEAGPWAMVPLWVLNALVEVKQVQALRLYVALHEWTSGDNRSCHPSRRTIADRTGTSVDTVDRDVAALVEIGALRVTPRYDEAGDQTSNDYQVVVVPPPGRTDAATVAAEMRQPGGRTDAAQSIPIDEPEPLEPENPPTPRAELMAAAAPTSPDGSLREQQAFELFWETYGRLGPKKKAWECWRRARKKSPAAEIQAGLEAWCAYWRSPGATKPKWPQGWLNEERWRDDPPWILRAVAETPAERFLRSVQGGAG